VKNDVPIALVTIGLIFAIYRAGERVTVVRAIAIALLCAAALTTKFSGVLLIPMAVILLLARALIARPWLVLGRIVSQRSRKLLVGGAIAALSVIVSYAGIWAMYGFRHSTTPDPKVEANFAVLLIATARNELLIQNPNVVPEPAQVAEQASHPPAIARLMLQVNSLHLLPEAWTAGFLKTYATTIRRPSFLVGDHRATGWWYYFPLAFLFKTPLATLGIVSFSVIVMRRGRHFDWWTIWCLAIPFGIYGFSALATNLNLGLRHLFPIIPIMYIFAGAKLANARAALPRFVPATTGLLGAVLIVETLSAAPNYIAYFNAPSQRYGPINLLGDSNLDWGQDLPLLRRWQEENPDAQLILDYFGGCDPAYYVKHTVLLDPAKPEVTPAPASIGRDGAPGRKVLAVSASKLQGIYPPYSLWTFYDYIKRHRPIAVLGGTIYLYELPLHN